MQGPMPVLILDEREIESAIHFYLDKLGFEQRWAARDEQSGAVTHAGLAFGEAIFMIHGPGDTAVPKPDGAVELWCWSGQRDYDLDGYYQQVRDLDGVRIVDEIGDRPWGDRTFKLQDPFGFVWSFGRALEQQAGEPAS